VISAADLLVMNSSLLAFCGISCASVPSDVKAAERM
jgi:hypothetical protein